MTLLLYLFLIFIGYFIVWPLIKVAWRIRSARNAWRDAMGGFDRSRAGCPADSGAGAASGQSGNARRKRGKKIGRDVGEYVAFEEEPGTVEQRRSAPADFVVEEQIEDAEWEDIR